MTFREAQLLRDAYDEKRKTADWPLALLFWQQANLNRNTEEHPQPFSVEEIMQLFGHEMAPPPPPVPEHPDIAELTKMIEGLNQIYNGSDLRHTDRREEH